MTYSARMTRDEFRAVALRSMVSDELKDIAYQVLVKGDSISYQHEESGKPMSLIHRACRTLFARCPNAAGELPGDWGVFERWYAARIEAVPPRVTPRGTIVPVSVKAQALRDDLDAWEPLVRMNRASFGRCMAVHGHVAAPKAAGTLYEGIRLIGTPDEPIEAPQPRQTRKPRQALWIEKKKAYPLRTPDGQRWVNPRTGEPIPDNQVQAYFEALEEPEMHVEPERPEHSPPVRHTMVGFAPAKKD